MCRTGCNYCFPDRKTNLQSPKFTESCKLRDFVYIKTENIFERSLIYNSIYITVYLADNFNRESEMKAFHWDTTCITVQVTKYRQTICAINWLTSRCLIKSLNQSFLQYNNKNYFLGIVHKWCHIKSWDRRYFCMRFWCFVCVFERWEGFMILNIFSKMEFDWNISVNTRVLTSSWNISSIYVKIFGSNSDRSCSRYCQVKIIFCYIRQWRKINNFMMDTNCYD